MLDWTFSALPEAAAFKNAVSLSDLPFRMVGLSEMLARSLLRCKNVQKDVSDGAWGKWGRSGVGGGRKRSDKAHTDTRQAKRRCVHCVDMWTAVERVMDGIEYKLSAVGRTMVDMLSPEAQNQDCVLSGRGRIRKSSHFL